MVTCVRTWRGKPLAFKQQGAFPTYALVCILVDYGTSIIIVIARCALRGVKIGSAASCSFVRSFFIQQAGNTPPMVT